MKTLVPIFCLLGIFYLCCFNYYRSNPTKLPIAEKELEPKEFSSGYNFTIDPNVPDGQTLFRQNCAMCHKCRSILVGPALMDIRDRRPSEWIYAFMTNPDSLRKKHDPYLIDLEKKFRGMAAHKPFELTREEIDAAIDYCVPGY